MSAKIKTPIQASLKIILPRKFEFLGKNIPENILKATWSEKHRELNPA